MMQSFSEIAIDLTAPELPDAPPVAPIEVDDIFEFDPLLSPDTAANTGRADTDPAPDDDTIEIELTAEQMEAMLSATDPLTRR